MTTSTSPASNRTPIIGGNWKMNTDRAAAAALASAIADALSRSKPTRPTPPPPSAQVHAQVAIFPPFVYIAHAADALARHQHAHIFLGAQDVYHQPNGAFTGEISTAMLQDLGVQIVLTGHSERRHILNESDELVNKKTRAVLDAGLTCILCIGETLDQRRAGHTNTVNRHQLLAGLAGVAHDQMQRLVIAYEPVWAIGTGHNASPADAQTAHAHIRSVLAEMFSPAIAQTVRIQYGGSMKASNAAELLAQPDIDGGLIGGASLKPDEFCQIIAAAQ